MEIVKQEPIDLEWSARLNLDPDRGDEEGKRKENIWRMKIFFSDETKEEGEHLNKTSALRFDQTPLQNFDQTSAIVEQ